MKYKLTVIVILIITWFFSALPIKAQETSKYLLPFCEAKRKCGFMDELGTIKIPPNFDYLTNFDKHGLAEFRSDSKISNDYKFGFINRQGKVAVPAIYDSVNIEGYSDNGLVAVHINRKYGFVNTKGKLIVPLQYDSAWNFESDGLASVEKKDKWGKIDHKGKLVIPIRYDWVSKFNDYNLLEVKRKGKFGFVNRSGKTVIPIKYDRIVDFDNFGGAWVNQKQKWGRIDINGKTIIKPQYIMVGHYTKHGFARVLTKDNTWIYINTDGKQIIATEFENTRDFEDDGTARVKLDGKWGIINTNGSFILPNHFDGLGPFRNGLAMAVQNDLYGYINKKGKMIIPAVYKNGRDFETTGITRVDFGGLNWGIIDDTGKTILPGEHISIDDFEANGLASFFSRSMKSGAVNRKGEIVVPPIFDSLEIDAKRNLVMVRFDRKEYWLDTKSNPIGFSFTDVVQKRTP